MELLCRFVIPGRPIVKKNTKKVLRGGKVVYSKRYVEWETDALKSMKWQFMKMKLETISGDLHVNYRFYFENHVSEPDVSNVIEGPQDLLEKVKVIGNDKQIVSLTGEKFFGSEFGLPRTEIEIYKKSISLWEWFRKFGEK